jgi:protein involved in polysaccharide export with SLBB domain
MPRFEDLPAPRPPEPEPANVRRIAVGDVLLIEILEALPGRPISGERRVRSDGTIGLGFYGDLRVAGLTRREAKVKVIEHMLEYLNPEILGLVVFDPEREKYVRVHPARSTRVFVDDSLMFDVRRLPMAGAMQSPAKGAHGEAPATFQPGDLVRIEVLEALPGRPISGLRIVRPDGTISLGFYGDLKVLGLTRDQVKAKVIEHLREWLTEETLGLVITGKNGNTVRVAPERSSCVFVDEGNWNELKKPGDDRIDALKRKLDRVLELLEPRRERSQ